MELSRQTGRRPGSASDAGRLGARRLPGGSRWRTVHLERTASSPRGRTEPDPSQRTESDDGDVRAAVDRLAPATGASASAPPTASTGTSSRSPSSWDLRIARQSTSGQVAFRHGPAVRLDGPGRRPQHPPRDGGAVARARQGVGAPRDVLHRDPRLQPARDLPPLPPGPRGDRAHPPAERAVLRAAPARGPRARRQPDQRPRTASGSRCSRASSWRSARRSRSTSPSSGPTTRPARTTCPRSACRTSTPASSGAGAWASPGGRSRRHRSIPSARPSWPTRPRASRCRSRRPTDAATPGACARSWGWATAEMLAINFGASMFNEYVRDANFNQISPRSFWENFEEGFTYDDNKFKTNQLIHPFNGSTYYNSARANGIGFWGSSAMALAGAFIWECCGETHPMSYQRHDLDRLRRHRPRRGRPPALLAHPRQHEPGQGRVGREATALLLDPVRGFNRLVSGDASEVKGNPVHPYDYRPDFQLFLRAGGRVIGEGESISENTNKYGFFEVAVNYGDAWDPDNRRPYDRFDIISQSNFGDKTRVGRLLIRGDIVSKLVGKNHSLAFEQDFDYIDNEAYEYGGQSFGPALLSRFELSPKLGAHHPRPGVLRPPRGGELEPLVPGRRRQPGADPRVRLRAGRGRLGRGVPRAQEHPGPHRALPRHLPRRLERLDLQQRHGRHRPRRDARHPAAPGEAGDPGGEGRCRSAPTGRCSSAAATTTSRAAASRPRSARAGGRSPRGTPRPASSWPGATATEASPALLPRRSSCRPRLTAAPLRSICSR